MGFVAPPGGVAEPHRAAGCPLQSHPQGCDKLVLSHRHVSHVPSCTIVAQLGEALHGCPCKSSTTKQIQNISLLLLSKPHDIPYQMSILMSHQEVDPTGTSHIHFPASRRHKEASPGFHTLPQRGKHNVCIWTRKRTLLTLGERVKSPCSRTPGSSHPSVPVFSWKMGQPATWEAETSFLHSLQD